MDRKKYECNLGESHKDLFQVKGSRQMNISRQTEEVTEVKMMKYFGERKDS